MHVPHREHPGDEDVLHGHVVIAGGGIGGLTAALSLQRAGLEVSVYERTSELREVGAGLVVSGSAMRGLELLGVGDAIRAIAGRKPPSGCYFDLMHYATGELIQAAQSPPGAGESFAVHRADLQVILRDAVLANDPQCLHLGHEFTRLSQDAQGVEATWSNGVVTRADALVGCDGVASSVRPFMFGAEPVVYTGKVSIRGLIPKANVTPAIDAQNGTFYVGPDRMMVIYYVRGIDFMNVVGHARQPGWEEEGWSIPTETSDFLSLYDDFCEPVREIIRAIPEPNLFKWALRDRPPMPRWTVGRVSLLGDAAHPMLPFLGQGGNQAIEDGIVLGRCFAAAESPEEAMTRYEAARMERANGVQIASRGRAEELMAFELKGMTLQHARAPLGYDPTTVPV